MEPGASCQIAAENSAEQLLYSGRWQTAAPPESRSQRPASHSVNTFGLESSAKNARMKSAAP